MRTTGKVCRAAVLLGVGALCALAAAQPVDDEPKLVLSQYRWDFGTLLHPQKAELVLHLTNAGTAELRITDIKSTCSCTVAQPQKRVLQPGESAAMKVVYDSRNQQGKAQARVVIHSNDPANPQQVFAVAGVVQQVVEVTPPRGVLFRMLDPNERQSQEVRLVSTATEPMQPKLGTFASEQFTAELQEIRPGREYIVRIATRPPIRQRAVSDTLTVATGLAAAPEIQIKVHVMLVDRVMLTPAAVYVKFAGQQPVGRTVVVEYFGDDPHFAVTAVTCPDPDVGIQIGHAQHVMPAARSIADVSIATRIMLEFPPNTRLPPDGLLFTVHTNDSEYPAVGFRATSDVELYRQLGQKVLREGVEIPTP